MWCLGSSGCHHWRPYMNHTNKMRKLNNTVCSRLVKSHYGNRPGSSHNSANTEGRLRILHMNKALSCMRTNMDNTVCSHYHQCTFHRSNCVSCSSTMMATTMMTSNIVGIRLHLYTSSHHIHNLPRASCGNKPSGFRHFQRWWWWWIRSRFLRWTRHMRCCTADELTRCCQPRPPSYPALWNIIISHSIVYIFQRIFMKEQCGEQIHEWILLIS